MSSRDSHDGRRFEVTSRPGEPGVVELDHEVFPFAGRFGRVSTGTAVTREADEILAAIAFSTDRSDATCCRIRYLAVRRDRQAEGIATWLADRFTTWAHENGFATVCIAVDSPFAAVAVSRAGFAYTGDVAPRGGVVMCDGGPAEAGLDPALERLAVGQLPEAETRYLRERLDP